MENSRGKNTFKDIKARMKEQNKISSPEPIAAAEDPKQDVNKQKNTEDKKAKTSERILVSDPLLKIRGWTIYKENNKLLYTKSLQIRQYTYIETIKKVAEVEKKLGMKDNVEAIFECLKIGAEEILKRN